MQSFHSAGMTKRLPIGYGFFYAKTENGFRWSSLKSSKSKGYSNAAVEWLEYMQTQPPFTSSDGKIHRIRHILNGPEDEIRFRQVQGVTYNDGFGIFPDGSVTIEGHNYWLFFDGCRFHSCDQCDTKCIGNPRFDERRKLLEPLGTVISMKGCVWRDLRKTVQFEFTISKFFNRTTLISETEIIEAIRNDRFFGFIKIDLKASDDVIAKWSKMNFPPVYQHVDIDTDLVPPHMLRTAKARGYKFPTSRTLTLTFHAQNILITTDLAQFYMSQGYELSNLSYAIEFEKANPLKDFVGEATKNRIAASKANNQQKVEVYKRVVNASYGRTGKLYGRTGCAYYIYRIKNLFRDAHG